MKTLLDPHEVDSPAIEWFDREALKATIAQAEEIGLRRYAPCESWRPSRMWATDEYEPTELPRLFEVAI